MSHPSHSIDMINQTILGEQYRSLTSHYVVFSTLSCINKERHLYYYNHVYLSIFYARHFPTQTICYCSSKKFTGSKLLLPNLFSSLTQVRDCSHSRRAVLYETVHLHKLGTAATPEGLCYTRLFTCTR
jgi:hypothetical protein